MATLKTRPSQLAIHGGGPPAFESRLPVFTANVGDGHRFAELAERMFLASETPGRLAEEFEASLAAWLGVRSVVGFSSLPVATRCLETAASIGERVFVPAFGAEAFAFDHPPVLVDSEPGYYGMCPSALAGQLRDDASAVCAVHPLGRPCLLEPIIDVCEEWGVPLFLYGHQALGCKYQGDRLGSFGHAEVFDLGRDQLIHAIEATVIATDDDLLAYRLRAARSAGDKIDRSMGDAAAAMGIANLEAVSGFIDANRARYLQYRKCLEGVPGVKVVHQEGDGTYQSIAIEVDPGHAGLTRNSLFDVLNAENVGTAKPFDSRPTPSTPVATRLQSSLLQLPNGPAATLETIAAVCKLIELAIVRSLESPDPIQLAA